MNGAAPMRDPSVAGSVVNPSKPKCSAHRSTDGEPCGNYPAPGSKVCRYHGASAPQIRAAAERRVAEAKVARAAGAYTASAEPIGDPVAELLRVASEAVAFKDFLAGRLALLDAGEWRYKGAAAEQVRAEVALYERSLDRAGKILGDLGRLDIQGRLADSVSDLSATIVDVLRGVLGELGLSAEQQSAAAALVPAQLALVAARMDQVEVA